MWLKNPADIRVKKQKTKNLSAIQCIKILDWQLKFSFVTEKPFVGGLELLTDFQTEIRQVLLFSRR